MIPRLDDRPSGPACLTCRPIAAMVASLIPAAPHHATARTAFGTSNASATRPAIVCFGAVLLCGYQLLTLGQRLLMLVIWCLWLPPQTRYHL